MLADATHQLFAAGERGLTNADLRAVDPQTQRTHIPHEVKAPWAEGHVGHHFADLLQDEQTRTSIARPAAQLLYYMVRCAWAIWVWVPCAGSLFNEFKAMSHSV